MTNSIFFLKKMRMAMFVVLVQIAHLPMVSMLMTFIKGVSWATVGFFQLYRHWLEFQAGIYEFAVIVDPHKIFPRPVDPW